MSGLTIAALGDIHSNYIALERCLEAIEAAEAKVILFLGDYVSDCACPQKTMALLRAFREKHDCRFVRGNREQYLLDHRDHGSDWQRGTGGGSLLYTYNRMKKEDLDFFESLPVARREAFGDLPAVFFCHGTPDDLRGWAEEQPERAQAWLDEADAGLYLCAHTHHPRVMPLERGLFVNTGSVGVAAQAGTIEFALLHGENGAWRPELVNIPYDVEPVIETFSEDGFFEEAGLWPYLIAAQLREGGEKSAAFVGRAQALWQGDGPIPEAIWQQAAREMNLMEKFGSSCKTVG